MKFTSPIITQGSGSVAGLTASHNAGGNYFRARSVPVNANTVAQQGVRNVMGGLVTAWITDLTAAQRQAWADYAANVPVTDSLGNSINLSGQNWYIKCNTPRVQVGLARVDDGPTTYSGATLGAVSITAGNGDEFNVAFDDAAAWTGELAGEAGLIVQASRPQNPTINYFGGPFRFADVVLSDDVTPPTSPATVVSPFPFAAGNLVYARVRLSIGDGRISAPQIVSTIAL